MEGATRSSDLGMDLLPTKRNRHSGWRPASSIDTHGGSGAPPPQRTAHGPTTSSPALGSWCMRRTSSGEQRGELEREEEEEEEGDSLAARGKVQRVCCVNAANHQQTSTHGSMSDASAGAAAVASRSECEGNTVNSCRQPAPFVSGSLPPRSRHHMAGCGHLSSASSLSEPEAGLSAACTAATVAAATAASATAGAPPREAGAPQGSSCSQPAGCGSMALDVQPTAACDSACCSPACSLPAVPSRWAEVPDDVYKRVLEQLAPSTPRVLRLVCRGWEAATSRLMCHLRPEAVAGKRLGRRFPALHSLDLCAAHMGVGFATPRLLRLQSLLQDEHLAELAGLRRLEQLSLRGCSQLSGTGLALLAPLSASLSMLNLSNCAGLTDDCLAVLAAAVPRLALLNLQGCRRVGDTGIAHLASMPCLRHILLPGGASDASMQTLVAMPALERVALRGCMRVTTAGVYLLLQRRGLQRVVISKCPQVTLESLCGESNLRVVAEGTLLLPSTASVVGGAALRAAMGGPGAGGGIGALAGQDMQLLVADV
ncbi:F-box/LRR-repeat protein 16 [Chlorella vulgaris]